MRQLFLAALAALALAACGRPGPTEKGAEAPASKPAAKDLKAKPVLLLSPEDMRTLTSTLLASGPVITGTLQPSRKADLRAEVAAVVKQVLKENGEPVRKGDLLVRLDDTALRESLGSAEETVRAATQAFDQAGRQVQRLRTLQTQGMTSMQALEDAEVRRTTAQSELVAAQSRVVTAREQLRRTEVRAPFDGLVSERQVSGGDTAQVGKQLLKVIDPASMRFEGLVTADRMHELKIGQLVRFHVNGYGQDEFAGTVRRIDAAANATTRQLELVVEFSNPASAPRVAGLFAEGRVETGGAQALMIPEGSVVQAGDAPYVWQVQGQSLKKVVVKLGERDARSGELPVLAGLTEGDRVLRNPGSSLVDGQKVEFSKPPVAMATGTAASGPVPPASAAAN
jgi:membrane fusion protein, multidrug efflux system